MNNTSIYILKGLRRLNAKLFKIQTKEKPECVQDPDFAAGLIYNALVSEKATMIARFGANELSCLTNYISIKRKHSIIPYIKGKTFDWWWNKNIIEKMNTGAGFFPPQIDKIEQFCELMLSDIPETDILGSWLPYENDYNAILGNHIKVNLELLNPFFSEIPWSRALAGKKVLVVHPFARTIENQYKKRTTLFSKDVLPSFELKTVQAVQSIAGEKTKFDNWFEALEWMKAEIDKQDYEICLIGCGAYGFPLAAHVKRMGKKAIHLGGSLQLLFGIKGKRWDGQYNDIYNYSQFYNEHWVRPSEMEKPLGAEKVETACYW